MAKVDDNETKKNSRIALHFPSILAIIASFRRCSSNVPATRKCRYRLLTLAPKLLGGVAPSRTPSSPSTINPPTRRKPLLLRRSIHRGSPPPTPQTIARRQRAPHDHARHLLDHRLALRRRQRRLRRLRRAWPQEAHRRPAAHRQLEHRSALSGTRASLSERPITPLPPQKKPPG